MYIFISDEDYEIAAKNGISKRNVYQRVFSYNWEVERAITQPLRKENPLESEWIETALANGIKRNMFYNRVKELGWSEEEAATTPVLDHKEAWKRRKKKRERRFTNEELETMKQNGIPYKVAFNRMDRDGWSKEDAITKPVRNWG